MRQKVIALLPMKANSERVKGKNFRNLAGRPLYQWILDALLSSSKVDQVIINTDAENTLREKGLVENEKILIRRRKKELCGDFVSMNLIIQDDIDNTDGDIYLMTHTTNPLITTDTIDRALKKFYENDKSDSLFSVNKIQTRFYREDLSPVNHDPDELIRTQDLEPWYEENSCLYVFTKESFSSTKARIGSKPTMFCTPPLESIDIDEPDDWSLAEAVALYERGIIK